MIKTAIQKAESAIETLWKTMEKDQSVDTICSMKSMTTLTLKFLIRRNIRL